ncbi:FEN1 [Hepatospora eriocheir]|uniref:FEN1 n=1 Tax=Hepatospora eriocheir TaxID=1081669 RepID=A0A1X0Q9C6_9MICR|nr:FEN1 [Hepatospora eriocheir]
MGVKNLWKIVNNFGNEVNQLQNKKLAVDTSIWIHQILNSYIVDDNSTANIYSFFIKRIIRLLYNNIDPIFIFDGSFPELKKNTIRERKEANQKIEEAKILQGIKENKKCIICNKKLRICEHGSQIRKDILDKVDVDAEIKMETHDYNWGEVSEEFDNVFDDRDLILNNQIDLKFNINELNTQHKKVQKLINFRKRRKAEMFIDETNEETLIESQIKNVTNRSQVSHLIREINKDTGRVQSDCTVYAELKKIKVDKKNEISNVYNESKSVKIDEVKNFNKKYKNITEKYKKKTDFIESTQNNGISVINKNDDELNDELKEYLAKKYKNEGYLEDETILNENSDLPSEMEGVQRKLRHLLKLLNIRYINSPYEADSQCAKLYRLGVVDGVISEDSDLLLYGVKVYKNLFSKKTQIKEFNLDEILEGLTIDYEKFIFISLFLGSDYCDGVKNIGPVRAMSLLKNNSIRKLLIDYDLDESLFREIKNIYANPTGKKIDGFENGMFDLDKLVKFLNDEDVNDIEMFIYHLSKINKTI